MSPEQHDINKLTNIMVLLRHINSFEFKTDLGKQYGDTIKQATEEIIKPFGRECAIKLKELIK